MSWGDVLGMCVVVLSAALMARESHKMGWAEGHGDGWRGAMEQNTNINGGLRAELAAAHEATDDVRKKLKNMEQRLATVGEEWNRALEERDRARGEIKRSRDELARTKALHQLELSEEEEHARTLEKLNDRAAADAVWLEHMKCMQTQMERQNQALERIANIVAVPAPSATSERAARAERLLAAVEGIAVHLERLAFRRGA